MKVIEIGVSLGVNLKGFIVLEGGDGSWNLEVEIAKIIEIGAALGFNFNLPDKGVVKAIAAKEVENVGRFQELQK